MDSIRFTPLRLEKIGDLHLEGARGLSAASGIVGCEDRYFVVPDDGLHLGCFALAFDRPGTIVPLVDEAPVTYTKAEKADLESLAAVPAQYCGDHGPCLMSLGSGSSDKRRRGFMVAIDSTAAPRAFDLGPLYDALSALIPALNVEGAAVRGDVVRLVHRGNSLGGHNAVIDLDARVFFEAIDKHGMVGADALRSVRPVNLGTVPSPEGPVPLTFTDVAPAPDGGYLFTASAENTKDRIDDGPVLASALGRLDADGLVTSVRLLDRQVKVEGVDARRTPDGTLDIRLVTDPDDPTQVAEVFRVAEPGI
ncbi:MAG: hypothetical protein FJX76_28640 [Armatimonadetes bacterium]|nr:hypothetical protein [Armatimonadota bacterium]